VEQIGDAMKEEKQEIKTDDAVDWVLLSSVLKAERASMIESVGEAIGVHGNQLLDEVEAMIDEKVAKVRDELASMLTAQVAMMLRQHAELRAEADVRMAALRKDLLGSDDSGVVQLPNPLRGRKAAA
jgi:S-adenosylmethionine:diacylglycerol 3-amino-3-carboxypropyl transferase